jgi:choline dehydrogenase-like flavoprotein
MSRLPDPIRDGLARGWRVLGGPHGAVPGRIVCDVAIIGSGAGAGITAELLTRAGLKVTIVEEGPLRSSTDFQQEEARAYPDLYQESAARKTRDKAITILQGRCVGGSTTVNWTSSFRTPATTLEHWRSHHGLARFRRGLARAVLPAGGSPALHQSVAHAAEREQRPAAARRREAGHPCRCHFAQRQRVLEPWLLRNGLPHERQAIDAGDHHPLVAGPRRDLAGAVPRRTFRPREWQGHGTAVRGRGHQRAIRRRRGAPLCPGRRCDQLARGPAAIAGTRSPWAARQAHLPAPDRAVRGHPGPEGRGLAGRTADDLQRPLPGDPARRRSHRLQAGGATAPSRDLRVHAGRLRARAGGPPAPVPAHARAAGAVARRLPRGFSGRRGAIAR